MENVSIKQIDRVQVIDALRGFALIGIIIAHCANQYIGGPTPPGYNIVVGPIDELIGTACLLLTFGKFFTIFSFLFGLSFAIQMDSSAKAGRPFAVRMLWRLSILFAIGFIHSLFYSGDILRIYALLGLPLLLLRGLGNRTLLVIGLILVCNGPLFITRMQSLNSQQPTQVQIEEEKKQGEVFHQMVTHQYQIKSEGTLRQVVGMNAREGLVDTMIFQVISGRLFITLGLFLLGLYVGRRKLFQESPDNRRFFRRMLLFTGLLSLLSTVIALLWGNPLGPPIPGLRGVIGQTAVDLHQISLSAFYVAGLTLLFWNSRARFLQALVAVGRMGLTIYLMQSFFGVLLFMGFGLGLVGKLSLSSSIALGLVFFCVQIVVANRWLGRYQYGPVEWLWRSLTYSKLQPLRKQTVEPALI